MLIYNLEEPKTLNLINLALTAPKNKLLINYTEINRKYRYKTNFQVNVGLQQHIQLSVTLKYQN